MRACAVRIRTLQPGLRDVQHALARERGYASWTAMALAVSQPRPDLPQTALQALVAAASRGDAAQVAELLDAHPDTVSRRGVLPDSS